MKDEQLKKGDWTSGPLAEFAKTEGVDLAKPLDDLVGEIKITTPQIAMIDANIK